MQQRVYEYAIQLVMEEITIDEIPVLFKDLVNSVIGTKELLKYSQDRKWSEIKAQRDTLETAGLPFKGTILDYDMRSAFKLEIAKETAKLTGRDTVFEWTAQDNNVITLTYDDLIQIPIIAAAYSNELHQHARNIRSLIYETNDVKSVMEIVW